MARPTGHMRVPIVSSVDQAVPSSATLIRFFKCAALAPELWANGAGVTRVIACGIDQSGNVTWRVSLAELNCEARFSLFAGFDRTLLTIDDDCVDLHTHDGPLIARPGLPVHFSGEVPIWVSKPAKSSNVVNVMTRRTSYRAEVTFMTHSSRVTLASTHIVLCTRGRWSLKSTLLDSVPVRRMNGIYFEGHAESLDMKPDEQGAQLVSIGIDPLPCW